MSLEGQIISNDITDMRTFGGYFDYTSVSWGPYTCGIKIRQTT